MIPGCTHALDITLDDPEIDLNGASDIILSINQNGTQLDLTGDRIEVAEDGYKFTVYLTQEETLKFRFGTAVAQVNWTQDDLLGDVARMATDPFVVQMGQQFVKRVL